MPDYSDKTTGKTISGSGLEQSALAFMADIGIITQFNFFKFYNSRESNCRAGVSFSNLGAAITGWSSADAQVNPSSHRRSVDRARILFSCQIVFF